MGILGREFDEPQLVQGLPCFEDDEMREGMGL